MPWKECSVMDERLRFVAQLLDGEAMSEVCREFGISRKTGYKIFDRYKEQRSRGPERPLASAGSATRTTMSSVKPIQKLCSLASMRRVVGSALTIVQLIFFAVASATGNAFSGASASDNGARSGYPRFCRAAVSAPA